MLPRLSGIAVLEQIRLAKLLTPVVMRTAKIELQDQLSSFHAGTDDYLPKPFFIEELIARIRVLMTRQTGQIQTVIEEGGFQLSWLTRQASWADYQAVLSQREFTLIEYLMRSPGHIFSRSQILKHVWGFNFDPQTNVVDVCIQRIQKNSVTRVRKISAKSRLNSSAVSVTGLIKEENFLYPKIFSASDFSNFYAVCLNNFLINLDIVKLVAPAGLHDIFAANLLEQH